MKDESTEERGAGMSMPVEIPFVLRIIIGSGEFIYGFLIGGGVMYMCFWVMYKLSPMRGFLTTAYTPKSESDPRGIGP